MKLQPRQIEGLAWTFASSAGFAMATPGDPTMVEFNAWCAARAPIPCGHVYYTGTATLTDPPTRIWYVGSDDTAQLLLGSSTAQTNLKGSFSAAATYLPESYVYDDGGLWFSDLGAAPSATKPINALGTGFNQWTWVSGVVRVPALPAPHVNGPGEVRLVDATAKSGTQYYLEDVAGTLIYIEENGQSGSSTTTTTTFDQIQTY